MIGQFFSPESHGSWTMVYRITAVTPDQGKVTYDVLDEREARKHLQPARTTVDG